MHRYSLFSVMAFIAIAMFLAPIVSAQDDQSPEVTSMMEDPGYVELDGGRTPDVEEDEAELDEEDDDSEPLDEYWRVYDRFGFTKRPYILTSFQLDRLERGNNPRYSYVTSEALNIEAFGNIAGPIFGTLFGGYRVEKQEFRDGTTITNAYDTMQLGGLFEMLITWGEEDYTTLFLRPFVGFLSEYRDSHSGGLTDANFLCWNAGASVGLSLETFSTLRIDVDYHKGVRANTTDYMCIDLGLTLGFHFASHLDLYVGMLRQWEQSTAWETDTRLNDINGWNYFIRALVHLEGWVSIMLESGLSVESRDQSLAHEAWYFNIGITVHLG